MKWLLILGFSFLFSLVGVCQDIPDLQVQDVNGNPVNLSDQDGKWLLLTASEAGCSFTYTAIERLSKLPECDQLKIIVLDYESPERVKEIYEEFQDQFFFVSDGEITRQAFKKQFSPQYQLYNPSGKLVWKAKGLKKLDEKKLIALLPCN